MDLSIIHVDRVTGHAAGSLYLDNDNQVAVKLVGLQVQRKQSFYTPTHLCGRTRELPTVCRPQHHTASFPGQGHTHTHAERERKDSFGQ